MRASGFLDVAEYLIGASEARNRSAVSRAYYAAFHSAKNLLWEVFRIPTSHHNTQDFLASCDDPILNQAANLVKDLYSHRITADYELSKQKVIGKKRVAQSVIDDAKYAISLLNNAYNYDLSKRQKITQQIRLRQGLDRL